MASASAERERYRRKGKRARARGRRENRGEEAKEGKAGQLYFPSLLHRRTAIPTHLLSLSERRHSTPRHKSRRGPTLRVLQLPTLRRLDLPNSRTRSLDLDLDLFDPPLLLSGETKFGGREQVGGPEEEDGFGCLGEGRGSGDGRVGVDGEEGEDCGGGSGWGRQGEVVEGLRAVE
jgi:hypothetical protein